ncbi:zinc finger MYM-type protein 5-like [Palaemon carinicauda]|uniref:zinc finger MYM-type protein 5-like n=1 Tax=Palaemon carinicauda TaxID=392227 RepID=UPI0035B5FC35
MSKRPSGAQYRKRKAEREKEEAKRQGSFLKYLLRETDELGHESHDATKSDAKSEKKTDKEVEMKCKDSITRSAREKTETAVGVDNVYIVSTHQIAETASEIAQIEPNDRTDTQDEPETANSKMIEAGNSTSTQEKSETEVHVQETADKDKSENEGIVTKDEESDTPMRHSGRPTLTDIDYSDPATWTRHDDQLRQQIVQHGPMQILDFRFPRDKNQRKFSSFHYQRHLPNGEVVHRKWLQYSVSTDSVMCFCCKLFGMKRISSLSSIGLRDWKNLSSLLSSHEKLPDHLDNVGKWKELEQRLKKHKTVDDETRCARERVKIIGNKSWNDLLPS